MENEQQMFGIRHLAKFCGFVATKIINWTAIGIKAVVDGIKMLISMLLGKY